MDQIKNGQSEKRYASEQLTLSYDHKHINLDRSEVLEGLDGKYIDLYDLADRPIEIRGKAAHFPTGDSARTSESAIQLSSKTNVSIIR